MYVYYFCSILNFSSNIEHVTPSLLAEIEIEFREINKWTLQQLRQGVIHIRNFFDHFSTMNC